MSANRTSGGCLTRMSMSASLCASRSDSPDDGPGYPLPRHGGSLDSAMTTARAVVIARSGPAVYAALAQHEPGCEAVFAAELREALTRAAEDLDLAGPLTVLDRWCARANMAANPLSDQEKALIERAKAGDPTGMWVRRDDGSWSQL